jgi:hypothetical protein
MYSSENKSATWEADDVPPAMHGFPIARSFQMTGESSYAGERSIQGVGLFIGCETLQAVNRKTNWNARENNQRRCTIQSIA